MRKYFIISFIILVLSVSIVHAQQPGVAINTNGNAPHSSAMLDIQSTSKGFLLPRMTQVQRIAISNPSEGLLVFDTDAQRLFQYQNGVWRFLIDNSFWAKSATRKWVYNGTDSVGIGTAAPSEKLHVVGNIKNSGRIDADGVIEGSGLSSLGSLYVGGSTLLTGAVTGNSSASFGGNINSNISMSINDPSGIFDFKNNGVDKGFIQLSGDNLRLGTYSSNTQGSFVVRTNGADQVKINNDGIALQNNGKMMRSGSGNNDLLPVCYGYVAFNGNVSTNTGSGNFTAEKLSTGVYRITCNDPLMINEDGVVTIVLTPFTSSPLFMFVYKMAGPVVEVKATSQYGDLTDTNFTFVMYK